MGEQHKKHSQQSHRKNDKNLGKSTFAQIIVWIFFIVTGFFVFYFFMKKVYSRLYVPVFLLENADFGQIVESFAIFMSMIIFINAFLGDWLDVVFHKTQNDLYRSHKNAVNNHILWSFIFFAAYLYNHQVIKSRGLQLPLIDIFLVSRVLYSIGYIIGALVGHQSLRIIGFWLSLGCSAVMLFEANGYRIMKYFK